MRKPMVALASHIPFVLQLAPKEQELRDILATVAVQDIEQQKDGTIKIKQGVAKDRVISTSDPKMRHGRKSNAHKFDGYKTHTAMETGNNFIAEIEVTQAIFMIPKQPLCWWTGSPKSESRIQFYLFWPMAQAKTDKRWKSVRLN